MSNERPEHPGGWLRNGRLVRHLSCLTVSLSDEKGADSVAIGDHPDLPSAFSRLRGGTARRHWRLAQCRAEDGPRGVGTRT